MNLPEMPNVKDFFLADKLLMEAYELALATWQAVCQQIIDAYEGWDD